MLHNGFSVVPYGRFSVVDNGFSVVLYGRFSMGRLVRCIMDSV